MNDKKRKIGAFLGIIALLLVVFLANRCVLFLLLRKRKRKFDSIPGPTLINAVTTLFPTEYCGGQAS